MLSCVEEKSSEIYVGTHPRLAETLVKQALETNKISCLQNLQTIQREKKYLNSRFDFVGKTNRETNFILEVKSVPLSDYEDISSKERKDKNYDGKDVTDKVAYFPDGYRKNKNQLVSPRALKHIEELEEIRNTHNDIETHLCYVVQREDCNRFQTSVLDPIYKNAVKKANENNVNVIALQIRWTRNGEAHLLTDNLPISL